jgi:hypothetical protein
MTRIIFFCVLFYSSATLAWKDPTEGKPFFPWVWEDQLHPTLKNSIDGHGVSILAAGSGVTWLTRVYDHKVDDSIREHGFLMGKEDATYWGKIGNGMIGVSIAAGQLAFDQKNGLKTVRAMILATSSHISVSAIARRNRPDNRSDFLPWPSSFPSGHTTNAFTVAGALAYSYGWTIGVPAYAMACAISTSRLRESRHWGSDIIAGITIGTFWARASFQAQETQKAAMIIPMAVGDGLMLMAVKEW